MPSGVIKPCSICLHPLRVEMERRIQGGESSKVIGEEVGCSARQLLNHFARGHVTKKAKLTAQAARAERVATQQVEIAGSVEATVADYVKQANDVLANVTGIYDDAIANDQPGLALAAAQKIMNALARGRELVELAAKMSGELEQKSFNLYTLPEWAGVCDFLVNVLTPYPEARKAVVEGLRARVVRTNVEVTKALEGPVEPRVVEAEVCS